MQNEVDTHSIEHLDFEHVLMCEARAGWCCDGRSPADWMVSRACCKPPTPVCNAGLVVAYQHPILCTICERRYEPGHYVTAFVSVGQ